MTREEALKILKNDTVDTSDDWCEAFEMAIKALEQEDTTERIEYGTDGNPYVLSMTNGKEFEQEPCDAVSRKAAIDACLKGLNRKEMVANIKALPPVNPAKKQQTCEDCVSREMVKVSLTFDSRTDDMLAVKMRKIFEIIDSLPSVTPAEKVGHWIYDRTRDLDGECKYECSECGMGSDVDYAYCMRCGCKMQEVKE